jgi:anaerobic ribonucleoside-triphosphate reductase activating protein
MSDMKVNVEYDSIVDGVGVRAVLFVSGCLHKCKGCHNPETHDFNFGKEFTIKMQNELIEYCKRDMVNGITFSGGDPMYNASNLLFFAKRFKAECPDKDIWIYSGFTYEEILEDNNMKRLLKECDILVDGKFEVNNQDKTYSFRGSYNQRIIDIFESLASKSIITWENTYL